MNQNYIPPATALKKLKTARSIPRTVYLYGATGYGKTELVRQYLSGRRYTYLSCEALPWEDGALCPPEQGRQNRRIVVIDDLHRLKNEELRRAILAMEKRDDIWLILISRSPIPAWLMPQHIKSAFVVISEKDLRMSRGEIAAYLDSCGVAWTEEDLRRLEVSAEGNAYVLHHAALRMKEGLSPSPELHAEIWDAFAAYLENVVLVRWDSDLLEFFMQVCVVDEFTLELAEMISGNPHVTALLERAAEAGNFMRQEDGIYRLRPVLIDALRSRALKVYGRERVKDFKYSAALYYEMHDEVVPALKLFEECGKTDRIKNLLIRNARMNVGVGHYYELRRYYFKLDEQEIEDSPVLMAGMSMLYSLLMDGEKSEYWYKKLKAYAASACGGVRREAQSRLCFLDISLPHRGSGDVLTVMKNIPALLLDRGNQLPEFSVTSNIPSTMNGGKDFCHWSPDDAMLAKTIGPVAERVLGRYGKGLIKAALGESLYEKGEDNYKVMTLLTRAQMETEQGGTMEIAFAAVGIRIRLTLLQGDIQAARELLASFEQAVKENRAVQLLPNIQALRCRLSLYEGNMDAVERWLKTAPDEEMEFCVLERYRYLTKVRCYLAGGEHTKAQTLLEKLRYYAEQTDRAYIRMETGLLSAITKERVGGPWQEDLAAAVKEAEHYRFLRLITEEGAAVWPLLQKGKKTLLEDESLDDMIAVNAGTPCQTVVVTKMPQSFKITYVLNGGSFSAGQQIGTYAPGQVTTLPAPEWTDHAFLGWYEDAGCTGTRVTKIGVEATGDKTFYAKWAQADQTYTLSFETNGGSAVAPVTAGAGEEVALDAVSKKSGYVFTGWYTNEALTKYVTAVTLTGDMTVYAGWQKIEDGEALYQTEEGGEWLLNTFAKACADVYDGGTVKLVKDVELGERVFVKGRSLTIQSNENEDGTIYTIKRASSYPGVLLSMAYKQETNGAFIARVNLHLSNICFDGGSQDGIVADASLVEAVLCNVYLGAGVSLQNNNNTSDAVNLRFGGGLYNTSGDVVMEEGSQIINCEACAGGGIFTEDGTITINGGKIEGNRATKKQISIYSFSQCGGGILCFTVNNKFEDGRDHKTIVNLISGSISNNAAGSRGGALYFTSSSKVDIAGELRMTGGTIEGNTADYGGAVYAAYGELTLMGGAITGNTATTKGGGIYCAPEIPTVYLSGSPNVTGNTAGEAAPNNIVLDGLDTDPVFFTKPIILKGSLAADAAVGVTRVLTPTEDEPVKLVAEPSADPSYVITEDDLSRFSSDDLAYTLKMQDGNIVMTIATRVAGLTVAPDTLTMDVGDTAQLTATVTPEDASNKTVIWSSSDESIATVDANGVVTAKAAGQVTITATTVDGGYTAACHVVVQRRGGGGTTGDWGHTGVPVWLNGEDHFAYVVGYADGTVRPRSSISRAEAATIFFRLLDEDIREENLTASNSFADINEGMWCNTAISTMAKLGIVKGRSSDRFDPNAPITRAEFAVICARFDTAKGSGESDFTDISGHWAEAEIERAATLGWVMGYTDDTFRPESDITRAEAMTMINRVLNRLPESEDDLLSGMNVWPDNKPGDWYYLAVQEATNSHRFVRRDNTHERWIRLISDPDWSEYQR